MCIETADDWAGFAVVLFASYFVTDLIHSAARTAIRKLKQKGRKP